MTFGGPPVLRGIRAAVRSGRRATAGNELGITGARDGALPLCPAHLCEGFTCGNTRKTWWRGCGCIPGSQGVAGSNPAVPTRRFRSEGVPGFYSAPFRSSGANRGHLTPVNAPVRPALGDRPGRRESHVSATRSTRSTVIRSSSMTHTTPVLADPQPVIAATVEDFRWVWVLS
jgi:hypothetical protein